MSDLKDALKASLAMEAQPAEHNIFTALAAAQAEMSAPIKDAKNSHFGTKYADLAAVVEAVAPALSRHGIAFTHYTLRDDGANFMVTALVHGASNTKTECAVPLLLGKQDMQAYKSATTYAKRIGLESVTGVAPEDDDGNEAAKAPVRSRVVQRTVSVADSQDGNMREPPHDPVTGEIHNHSSVIRDTWEDGIRDALPENATERQFLEACFEQLKGEFRAYATVRGLDGGWAKYDRIITRMQHEASDLFEDLLEVYTRAKTEIEAQQAANTEAKAKGEPILTKAAGEAIVAGIKACKDWRALDTFMQSLERGPNAHAARHPKIRMAEAERRAEFSKADPVVIGDVRIA